MFIAAIFVIGFVAASYYYYVVPHPPSLRILYTNSEPMLNDVTNEFKKWYEEWYGRQIEVKLIATDLQTAYERVTNRYKKPEAEIWWGGPLSLFKEAYGSLLPYNSTNKMNTTMCHFCPLMDLEQSTPRWYAASLHGLGLMYNEYVLRDSPPKNWISLLKEQFEGNITMVDPTKSEFTQPFIMLILQSQNWSSGWEYLVQSSAFLKHFDNNEAESALKVASGYLSIAILPDFYAYEKMAISVPGINFTYLDATVLQPDPIAIIRRGTYLEEAKAFIDFVLTPETQSIIGKYRLPVHENATVTPPRINPFASNFPYILNYNKTFEEIGEKIVKDYYQAWVTETHEQIKIALEEIREANRTRDTNPNATDYYNLAWKNFTYAGHYMNRTEIDAIYNKTNGWTMNTTIYTDKWWPRNSTNAYSNAIENAELSKQAAGPHVPFVAVYPYSFNNMTSLKTSNHYNYTDFLDDLDEIVELGFKGVKLWNVECFYDEKLLDEVMEDLASRNLNVIIPFQFFDRTYKFNASETPAMPSQAWNRSGFPYNETQMNAFLDYVDNVTKIVKNKKNLLWYSVYYPFNSSAETKESWKSRVQTPEYFRNLTSIIDAISVNDPQHPIYLVVELWDENPFPFYDLLPYNFSNVDGYGFQPYTTISDDINKEMIERLYRYFAEKGKKVYIDEWGVKTKGKPTHGNATTEENKSRMIREFVEYIKNWKIVWCYFGLRDFPPEEADFGLIDLGHELSREAMKKALTGNA